VRRNCRTCRIRLLRCVITPHRSNPTAVDRWSTSTSTVLWCTHWQPCPPGPAWPRHHAHGCKPRPPAPGPPGLRAVRAICLDTILLFSYPFLRTSPPLISLLLLIRQSPSDRVRAIELLEGQHSGHFMRQD